LGINDISYWVPVGIVESVGGLDVFIMRMACDDALWVKEV